ncbi:hypothetical protein FQN49_004703 [Arthroderma sp. PD_2]|nr:hypothetical protein FQN49_004703 [Arthroderma sp. PD_2]
MTQKLRARPTKAWEALSPLLPSRTPDYDFWWKLTGMNLASLVDAAGYPIERQYETLLFHYHWIVPFLGPAPAADGTIEWPTTLNLEGLPIEYSWKWNTPTTRPEIRYAIDAKGAFTGTAMDPLNQQASRELLHRLQDSLPHLDLTWTNHILATLFDKDPSKYVQEAAKGAKYTTTVMIAPEFKPSGVTIKTYVYPRKLGMEQVPVQQWKDSIAEMCPGGAASDVLYDFLDNSPEGKLLSPCILGVDAITPEKSRIKFYFRTPHTSFTSMKEIMTLGGRIPVPEKQLQDLRSLIISITGLKDDFPEDAELPLAPQFQHLFEDSTTNTPLVLPACGYYFNVGPRCELPEVKINLPLYIYCPDELAIGHGLTAWMDSHGMGGYCNQYLSMLESLAEHRQLNNGKGIQSFLSCMFKKNGEMEITSYLAPVHDLAVLPN